MHSPPRLERRSKILTWPEWSTSCSEMPIRLNGQRITKAWFNTIRSVLLGLFGGGVSEETTFAIGNNQTTQDITGLTFNKSLYSHYRIEYTIWRQTDTASSGVREYGEINAHYDHEDDAWTVDVMQKGGDGAGVDLTVDNTDTEAAQPQYTSSSIAGSNYEGTLTYKIVSTFNIEA